MLALGLALTGLMLLAFGVGWYLFPDSVLTCAAMTGPVVGAIIRLLIGLRPGVNLAVVLVATYIAIGSWGLL